jgi:arabinogalactan endo-1,4-beta-galactosidase
MIVILRALFHNLQHKAHQSIFYRYVLDFRLQCEFIISRVVQIGNEINNGFLWPVGEISVNGINPVSQLLHSAVNGARSVGSPKIMLHLANGWDSAGLQSFFKSVFIQGALATTDIDIVGVSFYPFYDAGATLSALKSSLTTLAGSLKKPIIVAETDWPEACSGVSLTEPSISVSTSGQETWITDIKNVLASLPNGLGQGIRAFKQMRCIVETEPKNFSLLGTWMDRKRKPWLSVCGNILYPSYYLSALILA